MEKINKFKKIILIPLLIISLVAFNFGNFSVFAEGEDPNGSQVEELEPYCGDANLDEGESCDDGGNNGIECVPEYSSNCQYCSSECQILEATGPYCGDGNLDDIEECDDANNEDGDGCSIDCLIEEEEEITGDETGEELSEESEEEITCEENEECLEEDCEDEDCEEDCMVSVVSGNEAEVENDVLEVASTGENEIEISSGDATINTGNINVVLGLFNIANSNLIDSDFSQFLFNIFESFGEDISLSDGIGGSLQENCGLPEECLNIVDNNQGSIENNVIIDASTGSNLVINHQGQAIINTGDINVVTNIFNFLNSNIVGSNWTQLIINVFADWAGDLVLPGKDAMQQLFQQGSASCGGACDSINIVSSNEGQVENDVYVFADTGSNVAVGDSSIIRTGNAQAETNIHNIVNSNLVGGSWFFMGINVFGNWQGNIFGLPPGFKMAEDFNGVKIYNLGSEDLDESEGGSSFNLVNDNSGFIKNSVIVNVSTGNNSASSGGGSSSINTGNANVFNNLFNVLNSNVTGSNWLLGMVNVFGSWEGDVAFGRPDLWIGASADTVSSPALPGETVTYTLTYINNGDADAVGVTITDDFDENHVSVTDSGGGTIIDNPGEIQWDLGTVPVGGSGSVTYSATISPDMPHGITSIISQSIIRNHAEDWNDEDNTDTLSVQVWGGMTAGPTEGARGEVMKIKKTNNTDGSAFTGTNVDYEIFLYNDSPAHLYKVVVEDVVINQDTSEVFNTYSWDLGKVFPKEEIFIDYTVAFGSKIPAGLYKNTAKATGMDVSGNPVWSAEVSNEIEIKAKDVIPEGGEEETDLEKIEKKVKELEDQIKIITEEVNRIAPPLPESDLGISPKDLIKEISGILAPEALAGVDGESLDGEPSGELVLFEDGLSSERTGVEKFLAAIGGFFFNQSPINLLIGLAILLLLLITLFLIFGKKIKKEKPEISE